VKRFPGFDSSWRDYAIESLRVIRRLVVSELELAGARRRFGGGAEVGPVLRARSRTRVTSPPAAASALSALSLITADPGVCVFQVCLIEEVADSTKDLRFYPRHHLQQTRPVAVDKDVGKAVGKSGQVVVVQSSKYRQLDRFFSAEMKLEATDSAPRLQHTLRILRLQQPGD